MSLIKLTWDIWNQFQYFKEYYSDESTLHDFIIGNLQGRIIYPTKLYLEENQDEQIDYFYETVKSVIGIIETSLKRVNTLKDFEGNLKTSFPSFVLSRLTKGTLTFLYSTMLSNFIENT